jgi:integrase
MTFLTREELLAVLRVAQKRRTRDWCLPLIAYRHGLRTTEACGLELSDLKDGVLSVQHRKGSRKTVQPLLLSSQRTAPRRS